MYIRDIYASPQVYMWSDASITYDCAYLFTYLSLHAIGSKRGQSTAGNMCGISLISPMYSAMRGRCDMPAMYIGEGVLYLL